MITDYDEITWIDVWEIIWKSEPRRSDSINLKIDDILDVMSSELEVYYHARSFAFILC